MNSSFQPNHPASIALNPVARCFSDIGKLAFRDVISGIRGQKTWAPPMVTRGSPEVDLRILRATTCAGWRGLDGEAVIGTSIGVGGAGVLSTLPQNPKTPEGISKNINVMSKGILGISKEI
jgi:hypothetical protein